MRFFQNKRGAELSVNVIIIAILAILVLVIVAFIFTGGTGKITDTIKDIFGGATGGDDYSGARVECGTLCIQAQALDDDQKQSSQFCTKSVAKNEKETDLFCYSSEINVDCDGVKEKCQ